MGLPEELHRVTADLRISGKHWNILYLGLRDEEPVKRIAMMPRQGFRRQDVGKNDWKRLDAVVGAASRDINIWGFPKTQFMRLALDHNLPGSDDAQQQSVGGILQQRRSFSRQLWVGGVPPQEGVRIEQDFHFSRLSV